MITRAEIVGQHLELGGYLYAKDFPEIVREIESATTQGSVAGTGFLGMSYEIAEVQVADLRAPVWILTKVTFTGAAILRRDKAAYGSTWIELGESKA